MKGTGARRPILAMILPKLAELEVAIRNQDKKGAALNETTPPSLKNVSERYASQARVAAHGCDR
jgi:hypothetical protein